MNAEIKVAFCAAYDWYFLKHSLPAVYQQADQICIAIDKDRISWAGKPFAIDEEAFAAFLKEIDRDGKIKLYQDDFHRPELNPMENEVRQRNLMAKAMGEGGWHLQLDSDEYFIDFPGFVKYLKSMPPVSRPINVVCPLLILYKTVEQGYLLVESMEPETIEYIAIATNRPAYEHGRKNGYFNVKTDFALVHQSWARNEQEIKAKIDNWGHKEDFDTEKYFERWKSLDENNYKEYKDIHPVLGRIWPSLRKVEAASIQGLIEHFRRNPPVQLSANYLRRQNSIWYSRLRALASKFR